MKAKALLFILFLSIAATQPVAAQLDISVRRDSIRTFFTTADIDANYPAATARVLDTVHREEGLAMLGALTSSVSPDVIERFQMTASYIHVRPQLSDSLRERIESIWEFFPIRPLQGEHERVAYYTALYLASTYFSPDAHFFNGKSREENVHDAQDFLLNWIRESTERGQREFDSPTYASMFFMSMLLLRDFARDEDLRLRAELMAQWLLADFAHDYLNGSYCGAHSREKRDPATLSLPVANGMSSIAWLYFGDGPRVYGRAQYFALLSDFQPHPAIVELATVRREPYESWERKRPAKQIRSGLVPVVDDVVRYTYMDPLYALGSIPGGKVQAREQHSWDVTWIPEDPTSAANLFVMHPWSDPASLLPFLPHSDEIAFRNIGLVDPYYDTVTKMVGGSPFEDVFQHRNTLIALYDLEEVKRFPLIIGYLPADPRDMRVDTLKSGWISINTGDVYIGMYPLKKFRIADSQGKPLFVSNELRNGVIVQVIGRNEAGSFKSFMQKLHKTVIDTSAFDSDMRIRYTTMDGEKLDFTYHGQRTVNGNTIGMAKDKLFDSPRLTSELGSGMLTIHAINGDVIIDMHALEIRQSQ
ncbi:hypothetical protein KQI65_05290 [bacterium]|nr:hypothetical protein [bacterium]